MGVPVRVTFKEFAANFLNGDVELDRRSSWEHFNFPFRNRDSVAFNGRPDSGAVNRRPDSRAVNGSRDSLAFNGRRDSGAVNRSRDSSGPNLRMVS